MGVLLVACFWWWWPRPPIVSASRQSLAILRFEEETPGPDFGWLSTALPELLSTDLAAGGKLRVIPDETIAQMQGELALGDGGAPGRIEASVSIGDALNTDFLVSGAYRVVGAGQNRELHLDLRLQETQRGETMAVITSTGTESRLFDLASEAAAELRAALGVKKLTFAQQKSVRATLPSSPEAFRLFLDGLGHLRRFDALAARDRLAEAIAIDPSHALSHAVFSEAWSALGHDLKAQASAARAYELAPGLPAESFQRIEGRFFESAAEWSRAITTYRELWHRFPDNVYYGLSLAEAQIMSGRGMEALETVSELRTLPTLAGRDFPRIDLAESSAASSLANYALLKEAAEKAAEKGKALGASILVANARRWQGKAHYQLHEHEQARFALEESRQLFEVAGDRRSVAEVLSWLADLSYSQGDSTAAADLYHRALAIHQETGNRKGTSETLNSLAFQLYLQGDLAAAREMLEEAVAIARETGDRYSEANYLDSLIDVLLGQGDLEAAEELAQLERSIYRELGNQQGSVWSLHHLGRIALARGDVRKARELHDQALVISDQLADRYWTAFIIDALSRDLLAAGDLAGARRMSDDSRALRHRLDGEETLAASQITSAEILLDLERPSEAEALTRLALGVYGRSALPDDELGGVGVLARSLVAQGKLAEAETALAGSGAQARASQNPTVRLSVGLVEAELEAAAGRSDRAVKRLETIAGEAHRLGLILLELKARLAWGKIEIAVGQPAARVAAGRRRLEALEKKAEALGCALIARKARAALAASGVRTAATVPGIRDTEVW